MMTLVIAASDTADVWGDRAAYVLKGGTAYVYAGGVAHVLAGGVAHVLAGGTAYTRKGDDWVATQGPAEVEG